VSRGTPFSLPRGALVPACHPGEELLLDYASGASSGPEAMMIATHLAFCAVCRATVKVAVQAGGALLDAIKPAHLQPGMLDRTLAAIDTTRSAVLPADAPVPPVALDDYLALPDWKKLPGGFRMRRVSGDDRTGDGRVWLFDAPPGMKLLPHRHGSDEWIVILRGIFVDHGTPYRPGDFACMADGEVHRPTIGGDERCVSLVMVRESPRFTTLLGKLSAPFVRL